MMEGKKMYSRKRIFKLKCFSPLKTLTSPFICRLLELLFFLPLLFQYFFSLSLSFFNAPSLSGLGDSDDIFGERQHSKILFKWHGMIWLIHDYEDGGVVDISAMNTYSGMELCMPIFLGEARK
jgi:hypothetical protein